MVCVCTFWCDWPSAMRIHFNADDDEIISSVGSGVRSACVAYVCVCLRLSVHWIQFKCRTENYSTFLIRLFSHNRKVEERLGKKGGKDECARLVNVNSITDGWSFVWKWPKTSRRSSHSWWHVVIRQTHMHNLSDCLDIARVYLNFLIGSKRTTNTHGGGDIHDTSTMAATAAMTTDERH